MPENTYSDGPCRFTSFLHLAMVEDYPEIKALHERHLDRADGVGQHGHALVAELVATLNQAYSLSVDLALFHAGHHDTGAGDPVLEWKRLAILLEQQLGDEIPCQVTHSLEAQFDLPAA